MCVSVDWMGFQYCELHAWKQFISWVLLLLNSCNAACVQFRIWRFNYLIPTLLNVQDSNTELRLPWMCPCFEICNSFSDFSKFICSFSLAIASSSSFFTVSYICHLTCASLPVCFRTARQFFMLFQSRRYLAFQFFLALNHVFRNEWVSSDDPWFSSTAAASVNCNSFSLLWFTTSNSSLKPLLAVIKFSFSVLEKINLVLCFCKLCF